MIEVWAEKYRPKKVEHCILPERLIQKFQGYVDDKFIPALILEGKSGVGKTTIAKAMCDQIGADWMVINGSMKGNIDTLRNDIADFASTVSLTGERKYVILDEGDHLTHQMQAALRNFTEQFSANCGLIITCNYLNKIMPEIRSRFGVVSFTLHSTEVDEMKTNVVKRVASILRRENVEFDAKLVIATVNQYFPDIRKVLNEFQSAVSNGKLLSPSEILTDEKFEELIQLLKAKQFDPLRQWIGENSDVAPNLMFRKMYDTMQDYVLESSIPLVVLIIAKYQYQQAFVADSEINVMACFVEIMSQIKWVS